MRSATADACWPTVQCRKWRRRQRKHQRLPDHAVTPARAMGPGMADGRRRMHVAQQSAGDVRERMARNHVHVPKRYSGHVEGEALYVCMMPTAHQTSGWKQQVQLHAGTYKALCSAVKLCAMRRQNHGWCPQARSRDNCQQLAVQLLSKGESIWCTWSMHGQAGGDFCDGKDGCRVRLPARRVLCATPHMGTILCETHRPPAYRIQSRSQPACTVCEHEWRWQVRSGGRFGVCWSSLCAEHSRRAS